MNQRANESVPYAAIETVELDWRYGTLEIPSTDRYIRAAVELTGEYSGSESDLYQSLLKPGDVAIDVGANVGVISVALGLAVGATGRVHAFEPQPLLYDILCRNLARAGLDNATAYRAIVAEEVGNGTFVDVRAVPTDRTLNFGGISANTRIGPPFGTMAPTDIRTIDTLGLDRCDFIKIDVEGGEHRVLAGATDTIRRHRPILSIECDRPDGTYYWIDKLLTARFRLWRFRGRNVRTPNPKGASLDGQPDLRIIMLLAIPEERELAPERFGEIELRAIASRDELVALSRNMVIERS